MGEKGKEFAEKAVNVIQIHSEATYTVDQFDGKLAESLMQNSSSALYC